MGGAKGAAGEAGGFRHEAMVVQQPFRKEQGMQESDMLDQLPNGESQADTGTDHIVLVSLGTFCGPKLSFKHMGRGAETLPFDWMRTRHSGLMHFIRNDFAGFFDFATKKAVPGCSMTTYRGYNHSFWHDDPTDPGMRERYGRRIERFLSLDASMKPVLFVRCIPSTDELMDAPELLRLLRERFGREAALLLIIDFQVTAHGAAIVEGQENLLVYYLEGSAHVAADGVTPKPPYCEPVRVALDWLVGKPVQAMRFTSLEKVAECADESHWGWGGLGGLNAFEAAPEGPPEEELPRLSDEAVAPVPACDSEQLESGGGEIDALPPPVPGDGVLAVSLGCPGAVKRTLQHLGRGREALPFDWAHVSHEGLLHFLLKGFHAPIRDGLGAGGQRPQEQHGFLDLTTRKAVPGTDLIMCRSHLHSFWHDDMALPEVRERYLRRIEAFESLRRGRQLLLFVRAVATSDELARAGELLSALRKGFGERAALLLVVDFQRTSPGMYAVEAYDDVLICFLDGSIHKEGDPAPYRDAVGRALQWMQGEQLEASCVPDFQTLHGLADRTDWGLHGLGGLNAFESFQKIRQGSPSNAITQLQSNPAEEAWIESVKAESAKESVAVLSLGCDPQSSRSLRMLDLAVEDSPFECVRIRLEGVIHFLQTEFKDFFEVSVTEKVPETGCSVRRSFYHSFWEGEVDQVGQMLPDAWTAREAHACRVRRLYQLGAADRTKLFVRTAATTEELDLLGDLMDEMRSRFNGTVCVLVLVPGQLEAKQLSVEGHFNLLTQFLPACASRALVSNTIMQSLDWVVGRPIKVSVVGSFAELRSLAVPACPGLAGPTGIAAFEASDESTASDGISSLISSSARNSPAETSPPSPP